MTDSTKTFRIGGSKLIATMYPEVYFRFISELNRNHQDLMRLMSMAQVSFIDFSAVDYLNGILGTHVKQYDPMELGYAQLLDALRMRVRSDITTANSERVAADRLDAITNGPTRDSSSRGKPLFPEWDEAKENEARNKKH